MDQKQAISDFAKQLIDAIEKGTAPWQKPWRACEAMLNAPQNPSTGRAYSGVNSLVLGSAGYDDPRWLTFLQAQKMGASIKKGEKGIKIKRLQVGEWKNLNNPDGTPKLGEDGKQERIYIKFDKPRVFTAVVFNAEQTIGLPPLPPLEERIKSLDFNPNERAEQFLQNSGAKIEHIEGDRAYYSVTQDKIVLPEKKQFESESAYYATALHELGHWTGHESRLNRSTMQSPFGSQEYAKEELFAEISSFLNAQNLGIEHNPERHASYVASWIKVLSNDPTEIQRAGVEAQKIVDYLSEFDPLKHEIEPDFLEENKQQNIEQTQTQQSIKQIEKIYLAVPFSEKNEAKALGAQWDKEVKSWYISTDKDLKQFEKWQIRPSHIQTHDTNPITEFAHACVNAGLIIKDIITDGNLHRVPVEGDRSGQKSGAYVLHLDGRPAGFIQNFKQGIEESWKFSNTRESLSIEELERQKAQLIAQRAQRDAEEKKRQEERTKEIQKEFAQLMKATLNHEYLSKKMLTQEIIDYLDIRQDHGNIVIPVKNERNEIQTLQRIGANGFKQFEKGGKVHGSFSIIGEIQNEKMPIIISTGVATSASIYLATKIPTVVAFQDSNLKDVAEAIRRENPNRSILIAGDNDLHNELKGLKNSGLESARESASAIKAIFVVPQFTEIEARKDLTDFSDLHRVGGLETVKRQINNALSLMNKQDLQIKEEQKQEQSQRKVQEQKRQNDDEIIKRSRGRKI